MCMCVYVCVCVCVCVHMCVYVCVAQKSIKLSQHIVVFYVLSDFRPCIRKWDILQLLLLLVERFLLHGSS